MIRDRRPHSQPAHSQPVARNVEGPMIGSLQALLLAFPVALFPAALVSDIAYLNTAEMQWSNFSAWLLAGGELFCGLLLLGAFVTLVQSGRSGYGGRAVLYFIVVLLFAVGLVNSFQHSRDAWWSVDTLGLVLSIAGALLALVAGLIGYSARAGHVAVTDRGTAR